MDRGLDDDAALIDQIGAPPSQLVFLLGPHRSGTTLLHHLLVQTRRFNYVRAYDVIEYPRLIANRRSGREAAVMATLAADLARFGDRGLDGIPVGPEHPEEYGFVLALRLYEPRLTPETFDRFRELCRKRRTLDNSDAPLLLKEPSEFYANIAGVHRLVPDAKFLFIHRHPLHVLASQVRAWQKALESRSHYGSLLSPDYAAIFESPDDLRKYQIAYASVQGCEWVLQELIRGYRHYLDTIDTIPRRQCSSDTYESLCAAPRRAFARIARLLELELPEPQHDFVAPRRIPIPATVRAAYLRHVDDLRDYLDTFDYPDLPDEDA
jgi:hypothetical protein